MKKENIYAHKKNNKNTMTEKKLKLTFKLLLRSHVKSYNHLLLLLFG